MEDKAHTSQTGTSLNEQQQELMNIINSITEKSRNVFENHMKQLNLNTHLQQMQYVSNLYQELLQKALQNPNKLASIQLAYWQDFARLWQGSLLNWNKHLKNEPLTTNKTSQSRRFQDEAWEKYPLFNFYKQFYELNAEYLQNFVGEVEGLDDKTRNKIHFYTQQYIAALSPENFVFTNPTVISKTLQTRGKNLLKGLDNMLTDLEQGRGYLNIKMTDLKAFTVGKNIACTPGKVIFQNRMFQLIHYTPQTDKVYAKPLLIIPPWINKYYILDLSPKNSFVKWLVDQGYSVFMISWINPNHEYAETGFEDYLLDGSLAALDAVEQATQSKGVNMLGYCLGGTLLGCTLAYLAAKKDKRVKSATYLATLLDFSDPGDLGVFMDEHQVHLIEQSMKPKGYLDGGAMSFTFNMLRANDLIWTYFVKNYLEGDEPFPFDLLYWNTDATNMPLKMHSFYLRGMYLNNLLRKPGGVTLNGVDIDLGKITIPVYAIGTERDHIAPWQACYNSMRLQNGPLTFVLGGSGHTAGIVNPPYKQKYFYRTYRQVVEEPEQWLAASQLTEGSWWTHWDKWLSKQSGKKIPAKQPGSGKLSIIEDAPGSYVQVHLRETE
ncbi:MAG: class I poly(R)-hydroxyalkanoic acid synthase [Gammaproteobacteria bacterium]